jgi:hypothetical protein
MQTGLKVLETKANLKTPILGHEFLLWSDLEVILWEEFRGYIFRIYLL